MIDLPVKFAMRGSLLKARGSLKFSVTTFQPINQLRLTKRGLLYQGDPPIVRA
jgi:hypothetical protein